MADRKPIIAGNWKMNQTHTDAISLVRTLSYDLREQDYERVDVVVCPPFTALRSVQLVLEDEYIPIALGAQNLIWEDEGAYTGEISGVFLKALHCSYVIIGHSERRKYFGETDETVNKRIHAALRQRPHSDRLCRRDAGGARRRPDRERDRYPGSGRSRRIHSRTDRILRRRLRAGVGDRYRARRLAGGRERHDRLRSFDDRSGRDGADIAQGVRIQYGGSVSAGNIAQLMAQPEIDGALVGGASLDPKSFAMIVKF